jgi:predicted metal-dependent hydrolase
VRRVEVEGRVVEVPVRVSSRSRRLKLVVDGQRRPEIVAPRRTPARAIDALLREHREWLARELAKPPLPQRLGLQRDDVVWLGGVPHQTPAVPSLERWYRERAREQLTAAVAAEGARLGIGYRSVAVRDQRTRWGSCSPRGVLSFNWRLVLAPADALRYVVVHELCHRLRHDHSSAYWRLVEDALPSYRDARAWLDEHGHELLAYSVPG